LDDKQLPNRILEEQQCCFDPGGLGKMGRAELLPSPFQIAELSGLFSTERSENKYYLLLL
jgi:hypothetical protein